MGCFPPKFIIKKGMTAQDSVIRRGCLSEKRVADPVHPQVISPPPPGQRSFNNDSILKIKFKLSAKQRSWNFLNPCHPKRDTQGKHIRRAKSDIFLGQKIGESDIFGSK